MKEMTKDTIWQQVNKHGVLIIKLNKYNITWFIIIKHIYNKIISCLWFKFLLKFMGGRKHSLNLIQSGRGQRPLVFLL